MRRLHHGRNPVRRGKAGEGIPQAPSFFFEFGVQLEGGEGTLLMIIKWDSAV
ncbi:hypothetical protein HMPREF9946_01977 [Acetobacteraceae bacterium AT-5844]|nr:hypothetical protein HMPREF9946_01977 [Acetobacteraceae bacterium AT-5844]